MMNLLASSGVLGSTQVPFIHDLQGYFLYVIVPGFLGLMVTVLSISVLIRWGTRAIHSEGGGWVYVTPSMVDDEYEGNYGWTQLDRIPRVR